jgi:hypothetical protein
MPATSLERHLWSQEACKVGYEFRHSLQCSVIAGNAACLGVCSQLVVWLLARKQQDGSGLSKSSALGDKLWASAFVSKVIVCCGPCAVC